MSIFSEEFAKFKGEIMEHFGKSVIFSKCLLELLYRKSLKFIFYTITLSLILGALFSAIYYASMYFGLVNSFSDFILTVGIIVVVFLFAIFLLYIGNNESSYQGSALPKSPEGEMLNVQKEILKTQRRIAASNASMDYQSWLNNNRK